MVYETENTKTAASLFEGWEDGVIWSCLQGIMGHLYVTDRENPQSAAIMLGDFCFLAGEPNRELLLHRPDWMRRDFLIAAARDEEWFSMIEECYGPRARRVVRYAIKKEPGIFDEERLCKAAASLPDGYELRLIDRELYAVCRETDWSRDLTVNYPDYESFLAHGLGVAALRGGEIAAGASSYCGFEGGIEVEIITRADCRRRGLAYACGARLILECLARGLYPSWDAQNIRSKGLALKLGYHFDQEYATYEIGNAGHRT